MIIAALSLLGGLLLAGNEDWPRSATRPVFWLMLLAGVAFTVYSEWVNVNVRGSWGYSDLMPTVPVLGTGLSPLMQWIAVPGCVQRLIFGHWPWTQRRM